MNKYQCIIVAVDLNTNTDALTIKRAKKIADDNTAKLYLVHAIESLNAYGTPYVDIAFTEVEDGISAEHRKQLLHEAKQQSIPTDNLIIEVGAPNVVIVNQARKLNADLIVVGAHSQHGLGLLLGSTADSVLHSAPCDVLAMHLKN